MARSLVAMGWNSSTILEGLSGYLANSALWWDKLISKRILFGKFCFVVGAIDFQEKPV